MIPLIRRNLAPKKIANKKSLEEHPAVGNSHLTKFQEKPQKEHLAENIIKKPLVNGRKT
jgi:hypothetical protein